MTEINEKLEWIDKFIEGELSPDEADLLAEWLDRSEETRKLFRANIHLDWLLNKRYRNLPNPDLVLEMKKQNGLQSLFYNSSANIPNFDYVDPAAVPQQGPRIDMREYSHPRKKWFGWFHLQQIGGLHPIPKEKPRSTYPILLTLSLILVLLLIGGLSQLKRLQPVEKKDSIDGIARITSTINAEGGSENAKPLKNGRWLNTERIELQKGFARILFNNGADLILEGSFRFVDYWQTDHVL